MEATSFFAGDRHPGDFFETLLKPHETKIVTALRDISMTITKGEFFGIIGPNGSGKSTLIKILSCLTVPTSGRVLVLGYDVEKQRKQVLRNINIVPGVLIGGVWIDMLLTARENLRFCASLFGAPASKADEALEILGLADYADRKVITFSSGMMARLTLAQGLIREAPVILMDEPLAGVSFEVVREFHNYLKILTKRGITIVYATNNLAEAESLCDRVAILNKGEVVATGTPIELIQRLGREEVIQMGIAGLMDNNLNSILTRVDTNGVSVITVDPTTGRFKVRLHVKNSREALPEIVDAASRKFGAKIISIDILHPSLEDVFIELTSRRRE